MITRTDPLAGSSRTSASRSSTSSLRASRFLAIVAISILLILAFIVPSDQYRNWFFPIALWIVGVFYAAVEFRQRVMLFVFLMTFAFFLLAKPILMVYFGYDGLGWNHEVQSHLTLTLSLGLLALYVGHSVAAPIFARRHVTVAAADTASLNWRELFSRRLGSASLVAFVSTVPFSAAYVVTSIQTADEFGYTGLYVGGGGAFASLAAYGNVANTVALALYLATMPSARKTLIVILIATIPRAALLITGDRGDFGTFLLMTFVYVLFRSRSDETRLMRPRTLWALSVTVLVVILVLFITVGLVRGVGAGHTTLVDFLYGQGASLNVLEYGQVFADRVPEGHYLLLFADQGIFRFLMGGEGGLGGNSVAYALSGVSYSHSLSYAVLGDLYLTGRGVGTSYLAEAYADWGYVGVALVGVVYGVVIAWISDFPPHSVFMNALRLIIVPSVVFAPRGSATGFLADLLSPVTIIVMLGVWILASSVSARLKEEARATLR